MNECGQFGTVLISSKPGRPTNACIEFAVGHPLFKTHQQRLRSKIKVPAPRYPPRPPPVKPRSITDSWKKQAREFARFFLILFRPWRKPIEGNRKAVIKLM